MTPLVAMRAGGGIAAVSGRREGLPGRAGREVAKCLRGAGGRLCLSLPGGGPATRAILDSIGPSGPAGRTSDLAEAEHEERHPDIPDGGIPVVAAARGPEICDSCIRDGQIGLYANDDAASVHGGHAAHVPCRRLAKGLDARCPSRGAAAARLHVPAGSAPETVDGAGRERGEYGFDLAAIGAAAGGGGGGAASLWRQADAPSAPEAWFRMSGAGGGRSAGGGGGGGAHE